MDEWYGQCWTSDTTDVSYINDWAQCIDYYTGYNVGYECDSHGIKIERGNTTVSYSATVDYNEYCYFPITNNYYTANVFLDYKA